MASLLVLSLIARYFCVSLNSITVTISAMVLWFFMAYRSMWVGADTKQYVYIYEQIADISLSNLFNTPLYRYGGNYLFSITDFPKGYLLFNKLLNFFSSNSQTITIVCSTLIFAFLLILLKVRSPYPLLSLWLYFTLGIFQTDMNIMRNSVSIYWCYLFFDFIEKKRAVPFVVSVLLASTFHSSAILFIPLYWIYNNSKFTFKRVILLLLTAIVCGVLFNLIRPTIVRFLPPQYAYYFRNNTTKLEGLLVGVFHLLLVFSVLLMSSIKKWKNIVNSCKIGVWMLTFEVFFYTLGLYMVPALRMAALFAPYTIILIPNLIHSSSDKRVNKLVIILIVAVIAGLQYALRISINNIGDTMPYSFYWT